MSVAVTSRSVLKDGMRPLFERWPYHPHSFAPDATPERRAGFALESFETARKKGVWTATRSNGDCFLGAGQLEPQPWDTSLLGINVARISAWLAERNGDSGGVRAALLEEALGEAQRIGVQYLVARVAAGDLEGAHLLEARGFRLVDALLTFGARCETPPKSGCAASVRIEPFTAADTPALEEIAACSFSIDRFHNDPVIPKEQADALHRRWLRDSCSGFADAVLVARDAGGCGGSAPLGFTTLKLNTLAAKHFGAPIGVIVLVATSAAHRGRGIAAALTSGALDWFRSRGCAWAEVGTQIANTRASRVYQAAGFQLTGSSLTLRCLIRAREEEK